jgi:hypothetical protein
MHRFTKIITLASIGSAFVASPAMAATKAPNRVHSLSAESPRVLTIDVPRVATPAIATSRIRTPGPLLCAGVQSITLPASAGARALDRAISTPDSTSALGVCSAVPSESVAAITVTAKVVDVAPMSVSLPASLAADGSGAKSSAGDGLATAQAGDSGSHAGLGLGTGASDINVDVAPHL